MYCDAKGNLWMVSFNLLTRISFNEKGEVNRVLSISYPYKAPDLGLCDVYRNGTVVMCNNGVVSEFSVQTTDWQQRTSVLCSYRLITDMREPSFLIMENLVGNQPWLV